MQTKPVYTVSWYPPDNEWVAVSSNHPYLSWLAASPEEALEGLIALVKDVEEDMKNDYMLESAFRPSGEE